MDRQLKSEDILCEFLELNSFIDTFPPQKWFLEISALPFIIASSFTKWHLPNGKLLVFFLPVPGEIK